MNRFYFGKMVGNILRKSQWPKDLTETWNVILLQSNFLSEATDRDLTNVIY